MNRSVEEYLKEFKKPATLHLMVGLPCSGKTTEAQKLKEKYNALVFTPETWHLKIYGNDFPGPDHDTHHDLVESIMREEAENALSLGVDVILDFGFWGEEERDTLRNRAKQLGAGFKIHYMDVPAEELFERLEKRNKDLPQGVFKIPKSFMEKWIKQFQVPTPEELAR
jgi:predicted kinase